MAAAGNAQRPPAATRHGCDLMVPVHRNICAIIAAAAAAAMLASCLRKTSGGGSETTELDLIRSGAHGLHAAHAAAKARLTHKGSTSRGQHAANMLGRLERAHGIRSSKDMLAEIMSLRHYKKADKQISEMQHGFESHSSMSRRVMKSMDADEKRTQAKRSAKRQKLEASALRLEAGRVSRNAMLRQTERRIERKIGKGLVATFMPLKRILRHDERLVDAMVSPQKKAARQRQIVARAAQRVQRSLRAQLRAQADALIKRKKVATFRKSAQFLSHQHALVQATLPTVVDPAVFDASDGHAPALDSVGAGANLTTPGAQPWNQKLESFLDDTNKYIQTLARPLELHNPFSTPAPLPSTAPPRDAQSQSQDAQSGVAASARALGLPGQLGGAPRHRCVSA